MALKKINDNILYDIAYAIRNKLGVGIFYKPSQMANAIMSIKGEPTLSQAHISANGIYSAPQGYDGYNAVTVALPNTFSNADNGKVVSGASLVPQSSMSVSQNSIYDTTLINEMTVNVAVGSGTDTSDATLQGGSQMLSGYTAYARGSKYTGTIPMYNGSINSGSGSVPSYDYYSGSYTIVPSTVSQAFPTAGKIMSENLQVEAYSAGSMPDTYSGSYIITPSVISQAFPTAGKLMSQDLTVEAYSVDYYSGSYMITPSTSQVIVSASGKTFLSDLQIAAYNPSERAYQGSYVIVPSTTSLFFSTSGKVMLSDLTINAYPTAVLLSKHITSNGTYLPSGSVEGFDRVEVNVDLSTYSFAKFMAQNITQLIDSVGSVTEVPDRMFQSCSLLEVVSLPSCSKIGNNNFVSCSALSIISLPSCTLINDMAFADCGVLSSVDLPSVKYMRQAFAWCDALDSVNLPSVETISKCFSNCGSLTSVNAPNCEMIEGAFVGCSLLSTISLPKLQELHGNAFQSCVALSSIYFSRFVYAFENQQGELLSNTPFSLNDSAYAKIYVPSSLYNDFTGSFGAEYGWSRFSNCFVSM